MLLLVITVCVLHLSCNVVNGLLVVMSSCCCNACFCGVVSCVCCAAHVCVCWVARTVSKLFFTDVDVVDAVCRSAHH
jgi:hypothetical protein